MKILFIVVLLNGMLVAWLNIHLLQVIPSSGGGDAEKGQLFAYLVSAIGAEAIAIGVMARYISTLQKSYKEALQKAYETQIARSEKLIENNTTSNNNTAIAINNASNAISTLATNTKENTDTTAELRKWLADKQITVQKN